MILLKIINIKWYSRIDKLLDKHNLIPIIPDFSMSFVKTFKMSILNANNIKK